MKSARLPFALGIVVSVALTGYAISILDWPIFWQALGAVKLPWLAAAAAMVLVSLTGRALRWRLIGAHLGGDSLTFWRATSIGYLGNTILPMRMGELIRIWALSRLGALPLSGATASSILDRLTDIVTLCLIFALVSTVHGSNVVGTNLIASLIGVLGAALALIAALTLWRDQIRATLRRVVAKRWPRRSLGIERWLDQAVLVVRQLISLERGASVAGLCLTVFLIDFTTLWLVMTAFGWSLPFFAAVTLGTFLMIGSALPAAPGYVGVYQVAAILALQIYGVAATEAVAFSVVLQLVTLGMFVLSGGVSLIAATSLLQVRLDPDRSKPS